MSAFRQILLAMIVFVLAPPAVVRGDSNTAAYVGGSVKSIPMNIIGTLDVSEKGELRFEYGMATYKLPCGQITSTAVTQDETRHILHKIPVPTLPNRKKETLTINYKDPAGVSGTLNFELNPVQASALLDSIAIRKSTPDAAAFSPGPDWWGDRYWKTNRNLTDWEGTPSSGGQTAQAGSGVAQTNQR